VVAVLLISLMRAESTYHDKVYSRSGAVGLMQVMPSTGQGIASHLKVKWDGAQTLLDAETNIRFGAYYLGYLNKRFEGNVYWMLSGYNGGPSITSRWIKDFGHEDMDTAVFRIPYQETQYYLQKVMQNYWIYKVLYG
jgi:soluble lytic murein transglycosylase